MRIFISYVLIIYNIYCTILYVFCIIVGSHDTHIFRLSKPLDDRILSAKLDYPTNMWQAENGE